MSILPTARSLQTRIADHVRAQIETGQLKPGDRLPTLDDLAATYKCSVVTVRAAIDVLKQQGLVIAKQGSGTFVRDRTRAERHGIERYARSGWKAGTPILTGEAAAQGLTTDQQLRFIGEVAAPVAVAERLGIEPDAPVLVRQRTTYLDGRPNQLADSYYPLDIVEAAPRLRQEDTGPGGGYARLEDAGIMLAEIEERISPRMPTTPESVALELPEGTPVADLIRTAYDRAGRAVEVMLAVIAGDMTTFCYRFPIPE